MDIQDGLPARSRIQIDIEKSGQSELQNDWILVNQTLFDVGHGTIFVLQVVSMPLNQCQQQQQLLL